MTPQTHALPAAMPPALVHQVAVPLGLVVSTERIYVDPAKIEAVSN